MKPSQLLCAIGIHFFLVPLAMAGGHGGSHGGSHSGSHGANHSGSHSRSHSAVHTTRSTSTHATGAKSARTHVSSYTKKNGTVVTSHNRSTKDGTKANNWSTKGNVNPETGKPGTKDIQSK